MMHNASLSSESLLYHEDNRRVTRNYESLCLFRFHETRVS